ncbi:MAG: hypothetical protein E6R14_10880 [Thermomicrobiales bacterium]|nr:MAG: hypothetical protein E6R14_10880 [Thermomicrobiales bacterium]
MADNQQDERRELDDPIAYRDLSDQLPNEALREELARMTPEEREAYLEYLEELAKEYLGPGGP